MNPSAYQKLAERTECHQASSQRRLARMPVVRLNHAIIGLAGEVGELAATLERVVYYGHGEIDLPNIVEELGDCMWYIAEACNAMGLDLGHIMQCNIEKLKKRYPEKYDSELAKEENRNRQEEMEAVDRELQEQYAEEDLDCALGCVEGCCGFKKGAFQQDDIGNRKETEYVDGKNPTLPPLTDTYNRRCSICKRIPVHRWNSTGVCPDCAAEKRTALKRLNGVR